MPKLPNGYIDEPVPATVDLPVAIASLKRQKNALVLGHYYQTKEVQEVADYVGDSLGLAQRAAEAQADIILFAGVHFMAETAKLLAPASKVIIPDLNAGCSLADSCRPHDFEAFLADFPDHTVITYVNASVAIKALSDVCCTSSNALQIVASFPKEAPIVFAPDRNLGHYIKAQLGRENMVVWDGACHVHEEFSLERILEVKKSHPRAKLISHPECQQPILLVSDYIGSTSQLLAFVQRDAAEEYIVATEPGIIHQMQIACPSKLFIPAPPRDVSCGCSECAFMKLITLKKIYLSLRYELPEVTIPIAIQERAVRPIERMLRISKELGII